MRRARAIQRITLFEHERVSFDELGWTPDTPYIEQIDQLVSDTSDPPIYVGRHSIAARHLVGLLRIGDLSIQILPKIDFDASGDPAAPLRSRSRYVAEGSAMANLLHMLAYARDMQVPPEVTTHMASVTDDWFELLTRFFAIALYKAMFLGPDRSYVVRTDRLTFMRGKWLVAAQFTRRPHERHKFELEYDEFSIDNPLNQVFRYVVDMLLERTNETSNRRLLTGLKATLIGVTKIPHVSEAIRKQVQLGRLNARFEPAYGLAELFLDEQTLLLQSGHRRLFAFFLDMNRLFEQFVAGFLGRHRRSIFPPGPAVPLLVAQSRGQRVHLLRRQSDGLEMVRLVPDLEVKSRRGRELFILDTKYKRLGPTSNALHLAESDLHQMVAYLLRFKCPRGVLVYPNDRDGGSHLQDLGVQGTDLTIRIGAIDLHQPIRDPTTLIGQFKAILAPAWSLGSEGAI